MKYQEFKNMKAPLSNNFKQLHATQLSSSQGQSFSGNVQQANNGQISFKQSQNLRKIHQRSQANQQPAFDNEDLMSPPSIETFGGGSLSQSQRDQAQPDLYQEIDIQRRQRPITANRGQVMSQNYGLAGRELSQNRRTAQSTIINMPMEESYRGSLEGSGVTRNLGEWKNNTRTTSFNKQQHSSMQEQRSMPYQWPQVNTNSKRNLDFNQSSLIGNTGQSPYQLSTQYKTGGQKSAQYQRRDSVPQHSFDHPNIQPFQTIASNNNKLQMLSSRKLPDAASGQISPNNKETTNFYYQYNNISEPRTMAGTTNSQQTRVRSREQQQRVQVRQDHSSPLRGNSNQSHNDTQSNKLRASQNLKESQSQLNSAFGTLTSNTNKQFKQQQQQIRGSMSNTSTAQHPIFVTSAKQTLQPVNIQSNFTSIREPDHLMTPPVAPLIYDETTEEENQLRINENKRIANHSSQEEFESMVVRMHNRMKALESRYLDLANFYKRELLANGTTNAVLNNSRLSQFGSQQLREGDLTPYLAESRLEEKKFEDHLNESSQQIQQSPFDPNVEKDIINDLLREKNELEKELQDMMQYQINNNQISPNDLNESEINVDGRIRQQLEAQNNQNLTIEEVKIKVGDLLSRFQDDFLDFINRNYQSFTETDVLDMFSELRNNIEDILHNTSFMNVQSMSNKGGIARAVSSYHAEMQETLRQAITEYELNYGYNIQSIKKTAFSIQSKHGTALLDSKKAQIAVQAIYKKCGLLQEQFQFQNNNQGSIERSPQGQRNQGRGSSQNRYGTTTQQQLSPTSQMSLNSQSRLVSEIQGQIMVLTQSLYSISDKLNAGEDDLKYLMNELEDEHCQVINKFKVTLEQLTNEMYQKNISNFDLDQFSSPQRNNFMSQSFEQNAISQQIQELNVQLQADLQMAHSEIHNLKDQVNKQSSQNLALNRMVSFGQHQASSPQLSQQHQSYNDGDHRLDSLQNENAHLSSKINHLQRQLDEKSSQADRLASDLAAVNSASSHAFERSRERSKERVQLEQIQFYSKKYDDALTQTRDIVRLTQRFLVSLKKLQKAVHRKESNVSNEKNEFEDSRKELEARLKQVKREIDQLASANQPMKIRNQELINERDPYSNMDSRIKDYQNKAPQTYSERDRPRDQRIQQNPYRDSRSSQFYTGQSSIAYDNEAPQRQKSAGSGQKTNQANRLSLSREKSPVPLRTYQGGLLSRNQNDSQQRDMFRSIEAVDRFRHNPLLQQSTSNKKPNQTSSSAHKATSVGARSADQGLSSQKQTLNRVNTDLHYQNTLNQLRSDFNNLRHERDSLSNQLNLLQPELQNLRLELHRINKEHNKVVTDRNHQQDQELLQGEIDRLNSEIQERDLQIQDYEQRTKQIEENMQKSLAQLKERSQNKDLEIGQLRKTLNEKQQDKQVVAVLKAELVEKIHTLQKECDYKMQELEMIIQSKEQQIAKLERNIDKKMKENNQKGLNEQQYMQQISSLKVKYQEGEIRSKELQEEIARQEEFIKGLKEQHNEEIQKLLQEQVETLQKVQDDHSDLQSDSLRAQIDQLKVSNDSKLMQLQAENAKQLEKLKAEYQGRLEKERATNQESVQNALQQAKISHSQQMTDKDLQFNQKLSEANKDFKTKYNAISAQLKDQQQQNKALDEQHQQTIAQLKVQIESLNSQTQIYLQNIESLNFQVKSRASEKEQKDQKDLQNLQTQLQQSQQKLYNTELAFNEAEELINEVRSENEKYKIQIKDTLTSARESQIQSQHTIEEISSQLNEVAQERDEVIQRNQELEELINQASQELQVQQQQQLDLHNRHSKQLKEQELSLQNQQAEVEADFAHQLSQKDNWIESLQQQYNHLLQDRNGTLTQNEQELLTLQGDIQAQKQAFNEQIHQLKTAHNTQMNQLQGMQASKEGEISEKIQEITRLGLELAGAKSLCETLSQRITKKEQDIEGTKNHYNELVEKVKAGHQQELANVNEQHAQAINMLKSEYEEQIQELEASLEEAQQTLQDLQESATQEKAAHLSMHSNQLSEIKAAQEKAELQIKSNYESKIQQLSAQQKDEVDNMRSQFNTDMEDQAASLNLQHSQNLQAITSSYEQKMQQLKTSLESEFALQRQDLESRLASKEQEYHTVNDQLDTAMEEMQAAADQIQSLQDQLQQAQEQTQHHEKLLGELQAQSSAFLQQITEYEQKISAMNRAIFDATEDIKRRDQQIASLQSEKQQAIDQVKELIDQSTIEKQSLEDILKGQLTQALANLEEKDRILNGNQAQIDELQRNLRDSQTAVEQLAERAQEAEQAFEQVDQDLQSKDQMLQEHQQTLAKNRDLIVMLKDEYKKVSDKERVLLQANNQMKDREQELTTQVVELTEQVESLTEQSGALTKQVETLSDQMKNLKQEYAQKHDEAQSAQANLLDALQNKTNDQNQNNNSTYMRQIEDELKAKDELIDEANKYIEEFNDEKHELKAKFKHFIQIIEDPNIPPEDESSYKEDDEIDLNYAFDLFEQQLVKSRKRIDIKLQSIQEENSRLKDDLEQREEELRASLDQMTQVNTEITRMKVIVEENDAEMRRQMENASKKIDKYKEQLRDKQAQIEQLKMSLDLMAQAVPQQLPPPVVVKDDSENIMLLQKLQKAEQELQHLRQQQAAAMQNRISDPRNQSNFTNEDQFQNSFKVDAQRIQQMENQLVNLRRQLFEAKDQVTDQLTEQFAMKLKEQAKTFTQEHILKGKLSELKQNLEVTLNNNIKVVKVVRFNTSLQHSSDTIQKRLLIVQVVSNNECYVIDEAKLSEASVSYVKSYLPEAFEEQERVSITGEPKFLTQMKKLEDQVREIREERLELCQELMLYKEKIRSAGGLNTSNMSNSETQQQQPGGLTDLRGIELEEEVSHITAENLELRSKLKQLSEKNKVQQLRILELNDLLQGDQDGSPIKQKPDARLQQDIENLTRQLSDERRKVQQLRQKHGIEIDQHDEDEMGDNSFLEGIQVAENIGGGIGSGRGAHQDNGGDNLFDQSSMLLGVIEDFGIGGQGQQQERPNTNPAGNYSEAPIQVMEKLQKENEDLRNKLQQSHQNNMASSSVLNSGEGAGLIKHIKGTLLQFLKNCPVTDRNNEELLSIVYSMMEFTREEISEVQDIRHQKNNKAGVRGSSVSSGGAMMAGGTDPGEDEIRKKTNKGIFGIFRKGSRDKRKEEDEKTNSNNSNSGITPTKNLTPIGRR